MKRFPLFLALIAAPHFALAQPEAKPQPDAQPQLDPNTQAFINVLTVAAKEDNLRGVAMMGGFFNSIQMAKTGRGHFVMTKTTTSKDGKMLRKRVMDCTFAWKGDGRGQTLQSSSEGVYTAIENGQTKVERFRRISDGEKTRDFYATRNVWSETPQTKDTALAYSTYAVVLPWINTMGDIIQGVELKVSPGVAPEATEISATNGKYQAVFNADGSLRSWTTEAGEGDSREVQFDQLELGTPVDDSIFVWKTPDGAKQVTPAEAKVKFEF